MAYDGDNTNIDESMEGLFIDILKELKKLNLYMAEASGFAIHDDDVEARSE